MCFRAFAATNLFKLLLKYRPEDKKEKRERLLAKAEAETEGKEEKSKKPVVVKARPAACAARMRAARVRLGGRNLTFLFCFVLSCHSSV